MVFIMIWCPQIMPIYTFIASIVRYLHPVKEAQTNHVSHGSAAVSENRKCVPERGRKIKVFGLA